MESYPVNKAIYTSHNKGADNQAILRLFSICEQNNYAKVWHGYAHKTKNIKRWATLIIPQKPTLETQWNIPIYVLVIQGYPVLW